MDYKSKIINEALCINLASVVGPQLAFLRLVDPPLISIFIINKFISGVISCIIILKFL
ncbi:ethanolamine utilization protein EutH [Caldicellulosiruptoraceae bacterium PP1]